MPIFETKEHRKKNTDFDLTINSKFTYKPLPIVIVNDTTWLVNYINIIIFYILILVSILIVKYSLLE